MSLDLALLARRDVLGMGLATALAARSPAMIERGVKLQESSVFPDRITARPTRRLTRFRRWNQTPTYHQNACFSLDSRQILLATEDEGGNSAILLADVETGELTPVATSKSIAKTPQKGRLKGDSFCLNQKGHWAAGRIGGSIRLYDLRTFEEKVLLENVGDGYQLGIPIGSTDGKLCFFTKQKRTADPDRQGMPATHMQVEIATGKTSVILQEEVASCNHVVPCPADPDLLLIDRDLPPGFAHGGDEAKTTRVWTLNRVTGSLVEIRPRDAKRFQVHSNWNYRGDRLYYHGKSAKGGMYIGVAARNGEILWESWIPEYLYGHLSPHPSEDVIYTDGLYSKDMVTAVHYQQRDALGAPKLEMIAKHSTEWDNDRYGQYCHPHCHISPDGRWLTYNKGEKDRSDVYVVRIA